MSTISYPPFILITTPEPIVFVQIGAVGVKYERLGNRVKVKFYMTSSGTTLEEMEMPLQAFNDMLKEMSDVGDVDL